MAYGSAHAALRARTRDDHERVDAAFAGFDLRSPQGYAAFLRAHASVLPGLERELSPDDLIDGWAGRSAALEADLNALGSPSPAAESLDLPDGQAARWGAVYVMEGSRLGGAVLARAVGEGLPAAYLRSTHDPGNWRSVIATMERAATGEHWVDEAVNAAKQVFAAYHRAAGRERDIG